MRHIDVFNGDADGICALTQLRLAEPRDSQLVTGVKRDIDLLEKVDAKAGDKITVLDVSLDKNREPLLRALAAGAEVLYVDHHFAGEIPASDKLTAHINEAPDVCTSLLVNGLLKNRFLAWAVTGAFGDNLRKSAETIIAAVMTRRWASLRPVLMKMKPSVMSTVASPLSEALSAGRSEAVMTRKPVGRLRGRAT